jgi:hypothetical protein
MLKAFSFPIAFQASKSRGRLARKELNACAFKGVHMGAWKWGVWIWLLRQNVMPAPDISC